MQPSLDRPFAASDEKRNAPPVMLLSDRMWRSRFASDPSILGRTVEFDDGAWTVIGVMPPGFEYREAEFWVPLDPVGSIRILFQSSRRMGDELDRALAPRGDRGRRANRTGSNRRADSPRTSRNQPGPGHACESAAEELSLDLQPALLALLGAVAVVLLIACANLAGLMSVRASGRARELAIRSALGAGRRRMIRQLLTECLTLAVCGGAVGIGLAFWATRGLQWLSKDPRLVGVAIDFKVLLFAIGATLVTTLLFGIAPAIHASRVDAADALKSWSAIRRWTATRVGAPGSGGRAGGFVSGAAGRGGPPAAQFPAGSRRESWFSDRSSFIDANPVAEQLQIIEWL